MSAVICRVCLNESVGMHFIRNTQLQGVYEKLSNTKLIVEDGRPETVCHTCCLHLQRCYDFSIICRKADKILTQFYRDGTQISSEAVAALRKTLVSLSSMQPASPDHCPHEVTAPVNEHPSEEWSVQADVTVKREPGPVKSEFLDIEESNITELIKIEVTPENDEQDNAENDTLCLVGDLPKCATQLKEEKHTETSRKYTSDKTLTKSLGKPYTCVRCDRTFTLKSNLKAHTKTHIGEKLTDCVTCGKKFPSGYRWKRHMKSHTGEKPFACDQCAKTFPDKSHLKRHMRSHTGEMPFLCDICQKSLPDASSLSRHVRIHTGEKPFVCSECGKAYSDKDNFKRHMRVHTGEKPYACKLCDYKNASGSCLKLHLVRKHSAS